MTARHAWVHPLIAFVVLVLPLGLVAGAAPAAAAIPVPRAPADLPPAIEGMTSYVPSRACDPRAKPGTVQLAQMLSRTYPGTSYGIARACGARADSEHKEGRAVDWMNSARSTRGARQAEALLAWLFASDAEGNPYANARRLGIMYIIWDDHIWGAYRAESGWRPYRSCAKRQQRRYDSTCHRDHMHISLSWEGAMGATSFWSEQVADPDYGPCRPADLNWAAPYRRPNPDPCPRYARVVAPAGSSKTMKALVTYSGTVLRRGSRGPAVKAVQRVLRVETDGQYGRVTKAAMKKWQAAHGLTPSGGTNHTTWRALLADQAPTTGGGP